jgi:hypothetical protein
MEYAEFEPFIVPKIIQLHNAHFESKINPETISAYHEFIRNAPIEHLKDLKTTIKAIQKNPPPAEAPPGYQRDVGDDALAPPKEDDEEEDVVIPDEPGKDSNLPETSDEIKQRTMHRSEVHMTKEGKLEVICYDCSKKMLWASYERHLTTKTHAHNARERAKKRSTGNGLKKKKRVIRGRGPMDINKLRAAIKAIVN